MASTSVPPQPIVGVVDIGSNTIKMSVATMSSDGAIQELAAFSETVRLGSGLATTGYLAHDRVDAAILTLQAFADQAHKAGASQLLGVATEATRSATNGRTFLDRVTSETGWYVRTISGDEEAALTFRGLAFEQHVAGTVIVADIGGGSTELILAHADEISERRSLAIGSGILTDKFVTVDPPTSRDIADCEREVTSKVADFPWPPDGCDQLVVVGGTAEYALSLFPAHAPIDATAVQAAILTCAQNTASKLRTDFGIPEARARVLPAGLTIIKVLIELSDPRGIAFTKSGIRTGLLLEYFTGVSGRQGANSARE